MKTVVFYNTKLQKIYTLGLALLLAFALNSIGLQANAAGISKDRIASMLALQLMRGSKGYNHFAKIESMKGRATELDNNAQKALIALANPGGSASQKAWRRTLKARIASGNLSEAQIAVEMIRKAYATATNLKGSNLDQVIDSVLNTFPNQTENVIGNDVLSVPQQAI